MKKVKYWTVPEVHFICSQEKSDEKKAPWNKTKSKDNGAGLNTKYLLQAIG